MFLKNMFLKKLTGLFSLSIIFLLSACIGNDLSTATNDESIESLLPLQEAGEFSLSQLNTAPSTDWKTNGGSFSNQRWSSLSQIDRNNVSQLKGVWRTHLNGSGMGTRNSGEAQPLVYKGVIYTVTGDDGVFALDVKTGEILWSYAAELPANLGKSICCGWTSRGLGMSEDKIFVGQLDSKLVALDRNSGEIVWQVQAMQWQEGYSITSAPLYYDGMVITGFAGGEYGVRGQVKAFDANNGELLWTFYTVPGPGEFGHETWPQDNDVWMHGGGTVWQTPAVDPALGLLYFSTGNPGPDYNGAIRKGDNLFTDSIVAVDAHTGEYRWHFQQVHHDIWDYDASNPVVLFDLDIKGEARQAIAQAGKTGWVYILDRVTGEPLIGIEERAVLQESSQATAATQPYVIGDSFVPQYIDVAPEGTTLINQGRIFTPFGPDRPVMVQPSPAGSANWAPSAYDPKRQIMYVCAAETAMTLVGGGDLEVPNGLNGDMFIGGSFGGVSRPQSGMISALDMTTNKLVWQYRWQDTCYSGFVATAGDLLFVGRNDGRLTALDIDTGHQLWEFQTGAGMNSTVSIFEDEGEQFLVAYSAGNVFAGSYHGDSIWLFSLNGDLDEVAEDGGFLPQILTAEESVGLSTSNEPDLNVGKLLYQQTCLVCHGEDGLSGHGGGAPLNQLTDLVQIITTVSVGKNDMPGFYGSLTTDQIRDVSGYVLNGLFE